MQLSLLEPDDERWTTLLNGVQHDFYHLPGYVSLEATRLGGRPKGILVEEGDYFLFLPVVIRPVYILGEEPTGYPHLSDATSPYGYPTPLANLPEAHEQEFVRSSLTTLKVKLAEAGLISLFARGHPLIRLPAIPIFSEFGALVTHGRTVWIDLTLAHSDLWRDTRTSYRNLIARLERAGHTPMLDAHWEHLQDFALIYRMTMQTVGAQADYYFGLEYFRKLREALKDNIFIYG